MPTWNFFISEQFDHRSGFPSAVDQLIAEVSLRKRLLAEGFQLVVLPEHVSKNCIRVHHPVESHMTLFLLRHAAVLKGIHMERVL